MKHLLSSITEDDARRQSNLPLDAKAFAFYINGGLDKSKLEKNYVRTLSLLSQVCKMRGDQYWSDYFFSKSHLYAHMNDSQIRNLEDWCKHCLALSQTYLQASHFCQAEYCLLLANCVLPPPVANSPLHMASVKAQVNISLGKFYSEKLEFLVLNFLNNQKVIPSVVNYKDFEFERFSQRLKWPTLADLDQVEDAMETKKLALKFFNRALALYECA